MSGLDVILADDPYLADFVGADALEPRGDDVPQRILHPMLSNPECRPDGEIREDYEWGIVVNLKEAQVSFMDLTWIEKSGGWSVDDWNQFDSLTDDQKLELGLPLGLLIVPGVLEDEDEWVREFGPGSPAEETQRILREQFEASQPGRNR